jgi:hypothetical protein
MKKFVVLTVLVLLAMALWIMAEDIPVGRVRIPKAFVHAGQDFQPGTYQMVLTQKDGVPTFVVSQKGREVFQELAVVKPNTEDAAKHFKYRIKKELLKEDEYFRVRVITPQQVVMAYFLIKK